MNNATGADAVQMHFFYDAQADLCWCVIWIPTMPTCTTCRET